jgi:hypothetical protein
MAKAVGTSRATRIRKNNELRPIEIIFPSKGDAAAFLQPLQAKKPEPGRGRSACLGIVDRRISTVLAGRGDHLQAGATNKLLTRNDISCRIIAQSCAIAE